jgi:hypothetical protein
MIQDLQDIRFRLLELALIQYTAVDRGICSRMPGMSAEPVICGMRDISSRHTRKSNRIGQHLVERSYYVQSTQWVAL